MFCENCGKQIPDGVRFCPECGTPAPAQAQAAETRKTMEPQKKGSKGAKRFLLILLAVAVVAGGALLAKNLGLFGSAEKKLYAAAEKAVNDSDGAFKCEDLRGQMKEQLPEDFDGRTTAVQFMVEVSFPDYSGLTGDMLDFEPPEADPDGGLDELEFNYIAAAESAAAELLDSKSAESWWSKKINLVVAQMDTGDVVSMIPTIASVAEENRSAAITRIAQEAWEQEDCYDSLLVMRDAEDYLYIYLLSETGSYYTNTVEFKGVEETGDGRYAISIEYIDPQELYSSLAQIAVENYSGGYVFYSADSDDFYYDSDDWDEAVAGITDRRSGVLYLSAVSGKPGTDSFVWDMDQETEDGVDIVDGYAQAVESAGETYASALNSKWLISSKAKPSTGRLSGGGSGAKVTFKTSSSYGDFYVAFYKVSGSSVTSYKQGTLSASGYIRSGSSLSLYVSAGYYIIYYGSGSTWYGTTYLFGPSGSYSTFDDVVSISTSYDYTVTLYGISGGNASSSTVPYAY